MLVIFLIQSPFQLTKDRSHFPFDSHSHLQHCQDKHGQTHSTNGENQGLNRLSDFPEALQLVGYRNSAQSRPPDSQEATNPS